MYQTLVSILAVLVIAEPALAGWEEGVAAFAKKDYEAARSEFQQVVDQNPDAFNGHYMLGLSLGFLNRKEEALYQLRKAYDLNPDHIMIKLELGRTYFNMGRYVEASKLLGTVSDADLAKLGARRKTAFYEMRATARNKSGEEDEAFADHKEPAGELLKPEASNNDLLLKCEAEIGAQRYAEAVATCKSASDKQPNEWQAQFNLGQAYSGNEQFAEAEPPLVQAAQLAERPEDLKTVWSQLGFVYEKQQKYSQSIEAYQKTGDQAGVARVQANELTAQENARIEEENARIEQMRKEAEELERQLKELEGGGGR